MGWHCHWGTVIERTGKPVSNSQCELSLAAHAGAGRLRGTSARRLAGAAKQSMHRFGGERIRHFQSDIAEGGNYYALVSCGDGRLKGWMTVENPRHFWVMVGRPCRLCRSLVEVEVAVAQHTDA